MTSTRDDYGLLLTAPVLGAATVLRAGAGYLGVWAGRAPRLAKLGLESWTRDASNREGSLHEELVGFARESTDVITREMKRGLEDLEAHGEPGSARRD